MLAQPQRRTGGRVVRAALKVEVPYAMGRALRALHQLLDITAIVQIKIAGPLQGMHGFGRIAGKHTVHPNVGTQCSIAWPDQWPNLSDKGSVVGLWVNGAFEEAY